MRNLSEIDQFTNIVNWGQLTPHDTWISIIRTFARPPWTHNAPTTEFFNVKRQYLCSCRNLHLDDTIDETSHNKNNIAWSFDEKFNIISEWLWNSNYFERRYFFHFFNFELNSLIFTTIINICKLTYTATNPENYQLRCDKPVNITNHSTYTKIIMYHRFMVKLKNILAF